MPDQRLFAEGLPGSTWSLPRTTVLPDGAVGMHYTSHQGGREMRKSTVDIDRDLVS